ncbi:IS6 family transposase [Poseidonocella sp. HB161398]|uniref:IS6 family transposase n=1 Tax=Poseidonocella sp. HB161398 TaxID=2320855 RepID=UPI001486A0BC|nr:IS6 family transposase [Poseidonocella sp. HB161398]
MIPMRAVAARSGMSREMFRAAGAWLGHRRGGLALATIASCAAVPGSAIATAATLAKVVLPGMGRAGYSGTVSSGAIAAGGMAGIPIPPPIMPAVCGIITGQDFGKASSPGRSRGCRSGSACGRSRFWRSCAAMPCRSDRAGAARFCASSGDVTLTSADSRSDDLNMPSLMQASPGISHKRHRFPPEITVHAVWLYVRFNLSLREVEEMLLERGTDLSYETIRRWTVKFGPQIAQNLRRRQCRPGDVWRLDDVPVKIAGKSFWLWRAVDRHGVVLDKVLQARRDKAAAKRRPVALLKRTGAVPCC